LQIWQVVHFQPFVHINDEQVLLCFLLQWVF
jgi:hypothetical protein